MTTNNKIITVSVAKSADKAGKDIWDRCENELEFVLCTVSRGYDKIVFDGEDFFATCQPSEGEIVVWTRPAGFKEKCMAHIRREANLIKQSLVAQYILFKHAPASVS